MSVSAFSGRSALTRREVMAGALRTLVATTVLPSIPANAFTKGVPWRAINIMNFIRAEEPRQSIDLIRPVREQMGLIKAHKFPATWLLQYDAMFEGSFVELLKAEMPQDHEVGIWLEMNRKICDDSGIAWRGNPEWEWDFHVPVAYTIGYAPDERRRLADTAMASFRRIFGHHPKTVASWNLDAVTIAHLSDYYGIDAFGNCRDQLATDGFTIWGAPIAAYYPNRKNAWSPAIEDQNQISTPIFRLLGQCPIYYYDNQRAYPDTMEPAWPSGQSETFVDEFLNMITHSPTQSFAYAQLGQENSFGWPMMKNAYPMQMDKLARARGEGGLIIETICSTGRRFKHSFKSTPTQAQVMLNRPFAHGDAKQRTVWYQSKYYRANLHFRGNQFYLRDLHIYDDLFPEPYLIQPARQHGIEQRMLAVLDGYHWSDDEVHAGRAGVRAMGRFVEIESSGCARSISLAGLPIVTENDSTLRTRVPLGGGGSFVCEFHERDIAFSTVGAPSNWRLGLIFEWVPERSALREVSTDRLSYYFNDFNYSVTVANGVATKTDNGVRLISTNQNPLAICSGMARRNGGSEGRRVRF